MSNVIQPEQTATVEPPHYVTYMPLRPQHTSIAHIAAIVVVLTWCLVVFGLVAHRAFARQERRS